MLEIDSKRFRRRFDRYSRIGESTNGGLHRLALTDADKRVRDEFVSDLRKLGFDVRVDEIGNIFGRRAGTDPEASPVLVGSHLDSQPRGGRFDGQLGVVTALESLHTFEDANVETRRPIEVVNWTNEEGSRFQPAMLGSGVVAGEIDLQSALDTTDRDGRRLGTELERIGYDGDAPVDGPDFSSHLELHIEQGPTLEQHGNAVGIVEGVYGIAWLRVTIHGESDHAGPTPMHARTDALSAAADVVTAVTDLPTRLSEDAVATVGEFSVEPNSINVIPNRVEFSVDVRSYDPTVLETALERVTAEVDAACSRYGTSADVETVWHVPPTEFSASVVEELQAVAERTDTSYERMVSGAGHDAKYINEIAPTAMLFVPSVDGQTHNEAEHTSWDDCVRGATVFANAVYRLAQRA